MGNSVSSPGQSLIGWVELPTEVAKPLRAGQGLGLLLDLSTGCPLRWPPPR